MKYHVLTFFVTVLCLVSPSLSLTADETFAIQGTVTDADTKKPIMGASIRVLDSRRGSYSGINGFFRIPMPKGNYTIEVKSLGYVNQKFSVQESSPQLTISLKPSPVGMKSVQITGDISADNVIKRTIERKEENLKKITSFSGLLYSKFNLELEGKGIGVSGPSGPPNRQGGGRGSAQLDLGSKLDEKNSLFIMESYSKITRDNVKKKFHAEILQRRQTRNLEKQQNLLAIGNFVSFYDETVKIVSADILSPLSSDPFSRYTFSLVERTTMGDKYVYVIAVEPNSTLLPAFRGTLKIIEGTYNLIEADLSPSEATAISFVKNLRFVQKYEEIQKDMWQPTYLQVTAKAKVEVIKNFVEFGADVIATSIYNDIKLNEPIPDSVFGGEERRRITVAAEADSANSEFWDKNALQELTDREKEIYHRIDSIVAATPPDSVLNSLVKFSYGPVIEFNRIGSIILGAEQTSSLKQFSLSTKGAYSLGIHRYIGEAALTAYLDSMKVFSVTGKVFSWQATTSGDRSYSMLVNSIGAAFEHEDYYDYYRADGYAFSAKGNALGINFEAEAEFSRQFSTTNLTKRSIFTEGGWRSNPSITEGAYRTLGISAKWGNVFSIAFNGRPMYSLGIAGLYGDEYTLSKPFRSLEVAGEAMFSLIPTGYSPISLHALVEAGIATGDIPIQYQFRQKAQLAQATIFGNFGSAPIGLYGGTEYTALTAEINFTDIWWRAIGLPLYEGRGIDLIGAAASGRWRSRVTGYLPTGDDWYSEVGFGLARIPTFISNVIFLRFDARFGVGNLGAGNFKWGLGVSLPF